MIQRLGKHAMRVHVLESKEAHNHLMTLHFFICIYWQLLHVLVLAAETGGMAECWRRRVCLFGWSETFFYDLNGDNVSLNNASQAKLFLPPQILVLNNSAIRHVYTAHYWWLSWLLAFTLQLYTHCKSVSKTATAMAASFPSCGWSPLDTVSFY